MKHAMSLATAGIVLGLSACASTGSGTYARTDRMEVDYEKVALVNALSRSRGVQTTWVNVPLKRVPVEDGISD